MSVTTVGSGFLWTRDEGAITRRSGPYRPPRSCRRDRCRRYHPAPDPFGASPAALADPPNCTAADLAGVAAGVSAATSAYLFTHPEVE